MPLPLTSAISAPDFATQRLWIRPYTLEMALDFWRLLHKNRARLMPDFPDRTSAVKSLEDAQNRLRVFISQHKAGDLYSFGIWRKEEGDYIGDITLRRLARGKPFSEVGYYLGAQAEGQGYATEALLAMTRYAFQVLQMESVNLRCADTNLKSQRVAERAGFTLLKKYAPVAQDTPTPQPRLIHVYQMKKEDPNAASL
ncbi:GNAT family N-acetyltransferase [Rufibacter psychrotolerans]|uniref:GNAT family N-acetyltransferase n=1 Tax=Rufibacter psychrotolerans TaxID=2812556 RepID=UPI001967A14C|nr:GNAT family N-acetyltransferase [Rufibacter sp. SYSU D00308]